MKLPEDLHEVEIASTLDGSPEKSLIYCPPGAENVPLLVGLHTWSCDRFNQVEDMLPPCRERGWALILPEFRGPNRTTNPRAPQACASKLARQDIVDATQFALRTLSVDPARAFLLGASGGGHMAMMMAAYAPQLYAGISAWVGITDLAAWHGQNPNYSEHVEICCGGAPGDSPEVDAQYRERSPLTHVEAMVEANLSVHHGRYDRSVPYTHTWRLAQEMERLGAERFFCDIFDGGHELVHQRAFAWLGQLADRERGSAGEVTG